MTSTTMAPTAADSNVPATTTKRYHPIVVTLHWLIAILIFATVLFAGEASHLLEST